MKIAFFLAGLLTGSTLLSQQMILHDPVSARVFKTDKYSDIEGSPFLYDKWIAGSATIARGVYYNLELKLDVYNNKLYFNKNDELFEFQDDVKSFILMPDISDSGKHLHFKTGLSGDGVRPEQFVQVLAEGPVSIFKLDIKLLTDVNEINRGTIKTFANASRYFILKENKLQSMKLTKKDVYDLIKDKEEMVQAYVDKNNISTKKDDGLLRIIRFYNSL